MKTNQKKAKRERFSVQMVPTVAELKARADALGINFSEVVNECLLAMGEQVMTRQLGQISEAVKVELAKMKRGK